jgi:hypothetical protein
MQPATSPERKQPSQQGRKSILGRLSLSPASRRRNKTDAETAGVNGAPMPPIKYASLVSGGRAGDRYPQPPSAFAGPSYESMSPSTPPKLASPSLSQGYQPSAPTYVARTMPGEEYQRKKSGGASVGTWSQRDDRLLYRADENRRSPGPADRPSSNPGRSSTIYTTDGLIDVATPDSESYIPRSRLTSSRL